MCVNKQKIWKSKIHLVSYVQHRSWSRSSGQNKKKLSSHFKMADISVHYNDQMKCLRWHTTLSVCVWELLRRRLGSGGLEQLHSWLKWKQDWMRLSGLWCMTCNGMFPNLLSPYGCRHNQKHPPPTEPGTLRALHLVHRHSHLHTCQTNTLIHCLLLWWPA